MPAHSFASTSKYTGEIDKIGIDIAMADARVIDQQLPGSRSKADVTTVAPAQFRLIRDCRSA